MLLFLFVLTFVSYVVSTPTETVESLDLLRIAGGNDIDITEAPYQVSYEVSKGLYCGGVIVAKDIVLTAAHCVNGTKPEMYQVRTGSTFTQHGGQLYPVGDLLLHPDYSKKYYYDNDIAIFWLSRDLTLSDSVAPIQMMSPNEEIRDGELTVATGWGSLSDNGELPTILQRVTVPKVNEKPCSAIYQPTSYTVSRDMFCAGVSEGLKGPCSGDSGGPLAYNNKLAGIVSWGLGCAKPGYPGVYTKISALRTWIDKSIAELRRKHSS